MDGGGGLLDGLFSSVRRALHEESRRRPRPYPSNRRRAAAASTACNTGDVAPRSTLSSPTAITGNGRGAVVQCTDARVGCLAEGDDIDSPAGGYRDRLWEAEHGKLPAILAARAGGSEARDIHEKVLHHEIKNNADETRRRLLERRRHAGAARRARVDHMKCRREAFCHLAECRLAQARAQGLVKTRRLQLQCADSTRRLQELLHECVGEYEKARLRGLRRRRLSAEACDSVLAGKILDLRWLRFCARLEQDALGLVSARDMGNPTAEDGHGRNAGSSSSLSSSAAATATVVSLLEPLLTRSGLGDSRILRIVAICPRSRGDEGGGDSRSSSEIERSANSVGVMSTPGFGRLSHSEQRRGGGRGGAGGARGGGVLEALREELRDEGAGAPASAAVVLDGGADNSPLGVGDVFGRAVLCGNGGLVSALSCSDGALHGHRRCSTGSNNNSNGVVRASVVAPRRSSSVLPVVGPQGRLGGKELPGGTRNKSVQQKGYPNSNAGGRSGGDTSEGGGGSSTGCVVVGAEPGLLLSSSHLLWALRPPLGHTVGAAHNDTFDGTRQGADDVRSRGSSGEADRGDRAKEGSTGASGGWDRGFQGGDSGSKKATSVGGSRRERLDRDVAWIGATPLGSRVYYCLEEAEWEASRRREGYASSPPNATSTSGSEDQDSVPQHRGSRRRRRPRSAEDAPRPARRYDREDESSPSSGEQGDGTNSVETGNCIFPPSSEGELWQEDDQEVGTAHDRNKSAATAFAWSVSRMLAKVYLDPRPHPCTNPKSEGFRNGEDDLGDGELRTPAPAAWPSRTGGGASADSGITPGDAAAATFVVSGVKNTHRGIPRSKAGFDGDEGLKALAAIPDVLVAAGRPKLRGKCYDHRVEATPTDPTPLHFAPAGVLQLVGTPHFREFVEALPRSARARLSKLYPESSVRAAPIGQLYVALAPALTRGTGLLSSSRRSSAIPTEGASQKSVELQRRAGQRPEHCDGLPSYPPGPGGTGCPGEVAGVGPPMSGALVHPLPARAVRELLQIYVATTRAFGVVRTAVGDAGLAAANRHRTSGLFVPPPPPSVTAQGCSRGGVDSQPGKSGDDSDDDDINPHDQACAEFGRRGKASRFGERQRSAAGGEGQPEDLVARCEGSDSGSSDSGGRETDLARLAARPPSAVDILPDAPIQTGDEGGGGLRSAGIEPNIGQPHGTQDAVVDNDQGGVTRRAGSASIQGLGLKDRCRSAGKTFGLDGGESSTPAALFARGNNSMMEVPIASSLRTPFLHKYAAVLAPPPSLPVQSTGTNGNSDGAAHSVGQRAGAGGKPKNPFSDASALILQLKIPDGAGRDSPRLRVAGNCDSCGGGGAGDKAMMDRARGEGEAQSGIPPKVCGWRACLADASWGSLCAAHVELKDFLDGKAAKNGSVSDAFRFLPPGSGPKRRSSVRKRRAAAAAASAATPKGDANSTTAQLSAIATTLSTEGVGASNGEGELSVARSMSPLLSELLNGKLGKTIAMFCRRAVEESKASRRHGPKQQAPPNWARWIDPEEVKAADNRLDADARWAEKVLRAEKEVTRELRRLSNLDIYPVAELAHIRREHDAIAKEWQAVGGGGNGVEDGDGQYGGEEDEEEDNEHKTSRAGVSQQPPLMMLPPSGTKRRRREPLSPSLARYNATTAATTTPGVASSAGSEVQLLPSSTASGAGANGGHGGSATEKRPGGRRQRRKGSIGASSVSAGLAGERDPTEVRAEERGARGGGGGVGGRQALPGSQGRSEHEIELEFSRLKWALFRRRRQEAEVPRAFARGHAPGHGQALIPRLDATPPIFSPAGEGSQYRGITEVGAGSGGPPADTPSNLPVSSPATPTEQLNQLARKTGKHGGIGGKRRQQQQQQMQLQQLVEIKRAQPPRQAVYNDRSELPPQSSESRGPRPSSSTTAGTAFSHQRQSLLSPTGTGDQHRWLSQQHKQPPQQSQQATFRFPPTAGGTSAATMPTTTSNPGRRHTSPPNWESRVEIAQLIGSCSSDDEAAAIASAAAAEVPAQAILPLPRGTAERAMRAVVVSSDGSERGKRAEERRKGGSGRIILRRRASVAGVARAHHSPLVSRGVVGRELRGFDAAPYQTTVHFRDR